MSVLNANQLPSATGLDLGSASQRWDAFLQTLDASGSATVSGSLAVTGASTFTGNVSCGGTLAVTGASTLTGNVSCGGTLAVTGTQTFTGNTTCSGNITVAGTAAITGASTLTGLCTGNGGFSGALNGSVGATTPNTGAFTTLTSTAITNQTVKAGGLLSGNINAVTANTNTTNAQDLMTYAVAANSLNSGGRTLRIWCAGVYTTQSAQTPTLTFTLLLGGTTLATWTTGATTASQTNLPWNIEAYVITAATGGSGTMVVHGNANYRLGSGAGTTTTLADSNTAASSATDLTAAQTLKLQGTFSTNAASANSFTQQQMVVEWLNI